MGFIKKLLIYFIGTVFNKLIIFILLPIYTRELSPSLYGDADLCITTVTMLVSLLYMEVWTPLLRFSYDCDDNNGKKIIYCNVVAIAICCTPIYVLGCVFMGKWQNLPYLVWMILYGIAVLVLHIVQFEVRATGNSKDFMISGMISSVLQLIISFVGIYVCDMGAEIVLISPAVSNLIATIYLECIYKYTISLKKSNISKKLIIKIVKYSFPLAINAVAFWAMTNINRYFSREYLGEEANGYIALATKFIALINTLVQIYALAWQESAYEHSNSKERADYYSKMLKMYLDIMSIGTVVAILLTNIIFPYFIGEEYGPTQLILPIYYISAFVSSISNFYGHIFNAEKKTNILLYSTLAGAIANIVMLCVTINKWGIYAVPISLILGYCVNIAMRIFSISFTVKLSISVKRICLDVFFITLATTLIYINTGILTKCVVLMVSTLYIIYLYKDKIRSIVKGVQSKI